VANERATLSLLQRNSHFSLTGNGRQCGGIEYLMADTGLISR
jgi:hypothetical protein